ncbi:MAG TPA: UDP-3-O-acyl-N-acetylglucosamine deacetylase [Candidatus Hydrogenedens sp.]|nr:UDP-3-O-acyl-N-acetylglucosamine deacetylase [Candidatus Hydrogenedens sp.]
MKNQRTIDNEVSFSGVGLHSGSLTTVTFKPAPPDTGIIFIRNDLAGKPAIPADIDHVIDVSRGTTIGIGNAKVRTVEHGLAAMAGLGIDNLYIELDNEEIPNGDGSALPIMNCLLRAGITEQEEPKRALVVDKPVYYRQDDITLNVLPADELRVTMTIAYDHVAIGTQYASFPVNEDTFMSQIAPARTFCFLKEVKMLKEQGLIMGGSLESAVVIGDEEILNDGLRFPDEFVRHKILDLLGDTYLLGRPIIGHIIGVKSGHEKNVMFTKQIKKVYLNGYGIYAIPDPRPTAHRQLPVLDVNKILRILPHRYPFLLVDRIIEFTSMKKVVGIKNVTVNEPFFQGHWPDVPVMPSVLILEAMAQVSSVLIFRENGEPPFYQAYFTGLEKASLRRLVVPGDQLVVEAEMLYYKNDLFKAKVVASVENQVVAEATMTFGLVEIRK